MKKAGMMSLLALSLVAATKDRDWQTGKIMASRTVNIGARAGQAYPSVAAAGGYGPPPVVVARTLTTAELELFGGDFAFTIRDLGSGSIIRHSCRYIVGDPVRYFQDKSVLYLLDADGKECRAQIMTQERLPADVKSAAPASPAKEPK